MATAKDIMTLAESYIGTHEDPIGSNNVIFNTHYYGGPVNDPSLAWCCAFVWDIFRMAGASDLFCDGGKTAYCPTVASWGARTGRVVSYDKAKYGDIILFDWDGDDVADHIGLVTQLYSDGTIATVEGNTSDADHSNGGYVLARTRYPQYVYMIIRPDYDEKRTYTFVPTVCVKNTEDKHVFRVKCALKARGYYKAGLNYKYGRKARTAMKKFQKAAGLRPTGNANDASNRTLFGLEMESGRMIVEECEKGSEGKSVLLLKEFLTALGYYNGDLSDWYFGNDTEKALKAFQKKAGLTVTGKWTVADIEYMIG